VLASGAAADAAWLGGDKEPPSDRRPEPRVGATVVACKAAQRRGGDGGGDGGGDAVTDGLGSGGGVVWSWWVVLLRGLLEG
jgi:hypothetical protein